MRTMALRCAFGWAGLSSNKIIDIRSALEGEIHPSRLPVRKARAPAHEHAKTVPTQPAPRPISGGTKESQNLAAALNSHLDGMDSIEEEGAACSS
jgi:hypothetical protein